MPNFNLVSPFHFNEMTTPSFSLSPLPPQAKSLPIASETDHPAETASLNAHSWKIERPILTPPHALTLSDYRLLAATDEARNLGNQILDNLSLRLTAIKEKIKTISAENIQKLKEAAERANSSAWWSILKKIATCLLSSLSLVFGAALVASGGSAWIGGAMIASGVISLANFALSETQAWDWVAKQLCNENEEQRKKLAIILPAAIGILAGGIGLVGSVHSWTIGAIPFVEKIVYIAQTSLTLFEGLTTMGKGQADAQLLWVQADLARIQGLLEAARTHFDSTMREIESCLSDFKAVKAKVKKTVQIISQSNIQLVRQA